MSTTNPDLCPCCAALRTSGPIALDAWQRRVHDFAYARCLCTGRRHRPLMKHPHLQAGCAGYAWQPVETPQEVPDAPTG